MGLWPASCRATFPIIVAAGDDSGTRITSGTFGLWAYNGGSKYWDDLAVESLSVQEPTATSTHTPASTETPTPGSSATPTNTPVPSSTDYTVMQKMTLRLAGQPIAVRTMVEDDAQTVLETSIRYLLTDHLGSTSQMVNHDTGNVISDSTAQHYPFGKYRTQPTNDDTDMGFTGHKHNDDIGLIYMNARFYVDGIGRFANADTIVPDPGNPQSWNRYSYTRNNPVNRIDPTGHIDCDTLGTEECDDTNSNDFVDPILPDSETSLPRIMDISNTSLGEIGFRGLQIIVLPAGNQPEALYPKTSTVLGWGGAILDGGEALASAALLQVIPEILSLLDVGVSIGGSYAAGETGIMQPHPTLPNMLIVGQDVIVTGGEFAAPIALKGGAGAAGLASCGPVCGLAGIAAGNLADIGTSVASYAYDSSRMLGIIPTKVAVGIYVDSTDGRKMPFASAPDGLFTIALIYYQD